MITRRAFLGGLAGLVGGLVLEEAIPFNRVWSFPKQIVIPDTPLRTIYHSDRVLQEFRYVYLNQKTGVISPVHIATGSEADIMRGLIGTERRFDYDRYDVVAIPADKIRPF